MDVRVAFLVLFLLAANRCCDGRQYTKPLSEVQLETQDSEIQTLTDVSKKEKICTLCEEYSSQALNYLSQNKTQAEITEMFLQSCSQLHSLKEKCERLVNYYVPLFFLQISEIQPADFCQKVNLCQEVVMVSTQFREDCCGLCHRTVSEVLTKLKDPDTQMDIIEVLLKACKAMKDNEKKCKRMVFAYGPLILANTERFLEKNDICADLHACDSPAHKNSKAGEALVADS